jgi:diguanylate cyclase (GGDEF)-like protein/PAS domain S-box-containing protein
LRSFKWPLRFWLTMPIALPLLTAVGIVGWLSWRSGEMAINDLADQLMTQVSDRTAQALASHTRLPPKIAAWIAKDVETGRIQPNPTQLKTLDHYFLNKSSTFPEVAAISVGTVQGHFIGSGWFDVPGDAPPQRLEIADASTPGKSAIFAPSATGQRGALIERRSSLYVRQLTWYQSGIAAQKPTWTPPYIPTTAPQMGLRMTALHPLRTRGKIVGVAAVDFLLRDLSRALAADRFSQSGQVFVLEPNGQLVATSAGQPIYQRVGERVDRLIADDHPDPVIRESIAQLRGGKSTQARSLRATINGAPSYIRMMPWQDAAMFDWQIVVVVPEQAFTQQIQAHNRTTLLWSSLALGLAVGLSYWLARRVTGPILQLSQATREVAEGSRSQIVTRQSTWEMAELTDAVNHMAQRLTRSLANLRTVNQELFASKQRLYQVLEALPVGVVVVDPSGQCLYLNRTGHLLLGLKQVPQVPLEQLSRAYRWCQADSLTPYPWQQLPIVQALNGKAVYVDDLTVHLPNTVIPLEARAIPVADATGKVIYAIQTFQNVTVRKRAEAARQQSEHRMQKLTDNLPGVIFRYVVDAQGREQFPYISPHAIDLFGLDPVVLMRDPHQFWALMFPEDEVAIRRLLPQKNAAMEPWNLEYRVRLASGQVKWVQTQASPDRREDGSVCWDGLTLDITDRKHAETILYDYRQHLEQQVQERTIALQQANYELERLATLDSLTQIANRRRFDRYIEQEWQRLAREQQPLSLILCDVDYFKRYNDRYGHPMGDDCLQQVAQIMQDVIKRPADLLARYGGEEFAVILPQTNRWGAIQVAESLRAAIARQQIPHADSPISPYVSLSVGVACLFPSLEGQPKDLIEAADQALYQAKHQGRDRVCFTPIDQIFVQVAS